MLADSLTLIIRMTGLLLLTPDTPAGAYPLHVLMPRPDNGVETHVAEFGYVPRGSPSKPCQRSIDGVCFVDMDGWSMSLGADTARETVDLSQGILDLSAITGKKVDHRYLTEYPDDLRSRITLKSGTVTDTCALAEWIYFKSTSMEVAIDPLANVLTWTMRVAPADQLDLVRTRLGAPAQTDTLHVAHSPNDTVRLFIHQVPQSQADHPLSAAHSGSSTPPAARGPAHPRAMHLYFAYTLLGIKPNETRPIPIVFEREQDANGTPKTACPWTQKSAIEWDVHRAVGEMSCMIASAQTTP